VNHATKSYRSLFVVAGALVLCSCVQRASVPIGSTKLRMTWEEQAQVRARIERIAAAHGLAVVRYQPRDSSLCQMDVKAGDCLLVTSDNHGDALQLSVFVSDCGSGRPARASAEILAAARLAETPGPAK
jgi:hypothetical protein